ncbi:hypothetical protein P280DRAFT_535284 [Massarina eburnea CBS 473.64]|uniref:Uncharacterized protein n=1 Tax=Massarina eburnea CBS 473.64 TaxID=1395130 RepID=A0A6A6S9Y1_9PLEO|nr:hypothetical protein P280DRAFT_535284 [Massarina eburnea CBS 473.64]
MSSVKYSIPYDMLPMIPPSQDGFETTAFKPICHKKSPASFITKVFNSAKAASSPMKRTVLTAHHKKYDILEGSAFEPSRTSAFSTGSSSGYSSSSKGTHDFMLKSRRQRSDTLMSVTSVDSFVSDSGTSIKSGLRSTSSSRPSSPERRGYTAHGEGWVPATF